MARQESDSEVRACRRWDRSDFKERLDIVRGAQAAATAGPVHVHLKVREAGQPDTSIKCARSRWESLPAYTRRRITDYLVGYGLA